ncbi:MAG: hypothetical protein JXB29_04685 [Sedimentisphaerales bacterium]|nr:hypothetical protein [Sedimentisphaerales bacterium]
MFNKPNVLKLQLTAGLVLVIASACTDRAFADVRLPAVIGDNMVLQQQMEVPIWGWAEPGEEITLSGSWCDSKWQTNADKNGKWLVKIEPPKAPGPHEMTVSGKNTIKIKNILAGEVWLASGQSNMEMPVTYTSIHNQGVPNYKLEIATADFQQIRLFKVEHNSTKEPQSDCTGKWELCSPETIPQFSAIAYFFGRELHTRLRVPIGLLYPCWGGTEAGAWMSRKVLESDPDFKDIIDEFEYMVANYPQARKEYDLKMQEWKKLAAKAKSEGKEVPKRPAKTRILLPRKLPTGLYNGMIAPLIPYAMKGVIWYQGEGNVPRAYQYRKLFPAMIKNWRDDWGEGDFSFLFVQLANLGSVIPKPTQSGWAELREAQLMTLSLPNTAMAVAVDLGEADNIHPRRKQEVGRRLALAALGKVYGKDVVYSGPVYKSMEIKGNKIVLHFEHTGSGLVSKNGWPLKGFAIAGADRNFVWADADIVDDTVEVTAESVTSPVAVRYAWADNPLCTLYNKEYLPASGFRTDDWPGITLDKK